MLKQTEFSEKVIKMILQIPKGKVATYGQISKLAGKPHGARGVGWILHACTKSHRLPWQRVLNSQGRISFDPRTKNHHLQKKLLLQEGVCFSEGGQIDLAKFQWRKKQQAQKAKRQGPRIFS